MWPITRLEIERRRAGFNIRQLAEKMSVNPSLISQVENGWRKPYPKFKRIASEVLGVPEEKLFPEKEAV